MTAGLRIILLIFALIGYIGAGAALAAVRYRRWSEGERDVGMLGMAAMLFLFAVLCTSVGVGLSGVAAVGVLVVWASYLFMAQHMGLFRIEVTGLFQAEEEHTEESPRRAK
jgi:uncharacterized membrane protein YhiD involved in acid resistance